MAYNLEVTNSDVKIEVNWLALEKSWNTLLGLENSNGCSSISRINCLRITFIIWVQQINSKHTRLCAKAHGVKVYNYTNGGNHLRLIVLPSSRKAFNSFIRSISGLIARLILNVERGKANGIKFWDQRPFTRIIQWGKDFNRASKYLLQNSLEAYGFVTYQPRTQNFKKFESTTW